MRRIELAYHLRASDPGTPHEVTPLRNPMMDVLNAIKNQGSISGAAREIGLSYRHVWGQLKDWEAELGQGLIFWERGQAARLTPFGERLLAAERLAQARLGPQLESLRIELERAFAQVLSAEDGDVDIPTLRLYASHDHALSELVAFSSQGGGGHPLHLDVHFCGSVDAIRALNEGRCSIAGFHAQPFAGEQTVTARTYRPMLKPGLHKIVGFARRTQGLIVAPGNPLRLRDIQDVARLQARFVNRALGTGTRLLLDELLARAGLVPLDIDGYDQVERSHSAVALAVAGGTADVGLGTEYAARSARLGFVPITDERYLLVCLKSTLEDPPMQRLLQTLRSRAWQTRMASLPGYQPDHCGEVAAMKRLLPWWG
ncbi:substrate-binding domain-containing protein [Hydrogenophaga sp. XSHU_21]